MGGVVEGCDGVVGLGGGCGGVAVVVEPDVGEEGGEEFAFHGWDGGVVEVGGVFEEGEVGEGVVGFLLEVVVGVVELFGGGGAAGAEVVEAFAESGGVKCGVGCELEEAFFSGVECGQFFAEALSGLAFHDLSVFQALGDLLA
ncbi:hypothetical protein EII34_10345 [Arachnia propionica]|uniref:Uncharacterized protein n=1 Tax=Arachnia propionica TaxID=1750 RepID=A0A3P1T554_9ACTN|nr:hypothetical protein [Arachnia propionica]RRD04448.1 hypothetical protein EII34_10345 [Arachnia propionica]